MNNFQRNSEGKKTNKQIEEQCNQLLELSYNISCVSTAVGDLFSSTLTQMINYETQLTKEQDCLNSLTNVLMRNQQNINELSMVKAIYAIELLCKMKAQIQISEISVSQEEIKQKEQELSQSLFSNETDIKTQETLSETNKDAKTATQPLAVQILSNTQPSVPLIKVDFQSNCGLCGTCMNTHFPYDSYLEYFQTCKEEELGFVSTCGHSMSTICLAREYNFCFQTSLVKENLFFMRNIKKRKDLEKKINQTISKLSNSIATVGQEKTKETNVNCFSCVFCKDTNDGVQLKEINQYLKGWLEKVRQSRKKFECEICCSDDLDLEEEGIALTDCDHIFCEDCLRTHLITQINMNKYQYEDMKCPHEKCGQLVNNYIVDRLLNNQLNMAVFNRMIRLQLINLNFKEKYIKVASCPGYKAKNKDTGIETKLDSALISSIRLGLPSNLPDNIQLIPCQVIFTFNQKKDKLFNCNECRYISCLNGCEDNHINSNRGKNCKYFQQWKQEHSTINKEMMDFFDKKTMCQCPSCKAIIIRSGGCNHITCTMPNCGFEFCFKCQSKWVCWRHLHYF